MGSSQREKNQKVIKNRVYLWTGIGPPPPSFLYSVGNDKAGTYSVPPLQLEKGTKKEKKVMIPILSTSHYSPPLKPRGRAAKKEMCSVAYTQGSHVAN